MSLIKHLIFLIKEINITTLIVRFKLVVGLCIYKWYFIMSGLHNLIPLLIGIHSVIALHILCRCNGYKVPSLVSSLSVFTLSVITYFIVHGAFYCLLYIGLLDVIYHCVTGYNSHVLNMVNGNGEGSSSQASTQAETSDPEYVGDAEMLKRSKATLLDMSRHIEGKLGQHLILQVDVSFSRPGAAEKLDKSYEDIKDLGKFMKAQYDLHVKVVENSTFSNNVRGNAVVSREVIQTMERAVNLKR